MSVPRYIEPEQTARVRVDVLELPDEEQLVIALDILDRLYRVMAWRVEAERAVDEVMMEAC